MRPTWLHALAIVATSAATCPAQGPPRFERVVIDDNFPGGYQVEVADVNGDGKPDIIGVGGGTCAWYENPSWTKRVVSTPKQTPDIISSATADLDGDGKAEIAIAYDFSMSEPKRGKLLLAVQGATPGDPWTFTPIVSTNRVVPRSVGLDVKPAGPPPLPLDAEPSIHRLRWGWFPSLPRQVSPGLVVLEKKLGLVVAPIFGASAQPPAFDQEPAPLSVFDTGPEPKSGRWSRMFLGQAPVLHAIAVVDLGEGGPSAVLGASNQGVTSFRWKGVVGAGALFISDVLAQGSQGDAPKKGASEVHLGRLKDGRRFLATVEPWHGTDVAVYLPEPSDLKVAPPIRIGPPALRFGPRVVIDSTLKEGHALWTADVDGDGDDEVFAGDRGAGGGVLMYDFDGKVWNRTVLDRGVAAQDFRGGDLDGDGTPDIVTIGGRTHNVVWYRPIRPAR